MQKEREKLLQLHLITSKDDLYEAVLAIDHSTVSDSKKKKEKLTLVRNQINIGKKVLKKNINIPFSHCRSQRPVDAIIQELGDYIYRAELPSFVSSVARDPACLIGKRVAHKFEDEDTHEAKWFTGTILNYNSTTKFFEIAYDEEDENCSFDIILDLIATWRLTYNKYRYVNNYHDFYSASEF